MFFFSAVTVDELLNATEINRQDDQRTIIDKIIPNHPRIQELISNHLAHDPEQLKQQSPDLVVTSMYEGNVEVENDTNRNLWHDFR